MEKLVKESLNYENVEFVRNVEGGMVNKAAAFKADGDLLFVKSNILPYTRMMFESESEGLRIIASTNIIRTPKTYGVYDNPEGGAILAMEYLDNLQPVSDWTDFGKKIARLHSFNEDLLNKRSLQSSSIHHQPPAQAQSQPPVQAQSQPPIQAQSQFGFHMQTFYGDKFYTDPCWLDTWQDYFTQKLLEPLIEKSLTEFSNRDVQSHWSFLQRHLDYFFKDVHFAPSILVGDLCLINTGQCNGNNVVFDPATCYGCSEFDLTQCLGMFGVFPQSFRDAYFGMRPKLPGYDGRMMLYKLFGYVLCWNYGLEGMLDLALKEFNNISDLLKKNGVL